MPTEPSYRTSANRRPHDWKRMPQVSDRLWCHAHSAWEGECERPLYLCAKPDDCQGHYRRCTHGTGGPYTLACPPCVKQRNAEGPDYCRTDDDEGLPFPVDTYRSAS